jgi:hypothetical protein
MYAGEFREEKSIMNKKRDLRERRRQQAASQLRMQLDGYAEDAVTRLQNLTQQLRKDNPDYAAQVDWLMGQVVQRAQMMPAAVTAFYLANTEEPPEVVEGELIPEEAEDSSDPEVCDG